MEQVIKPKEHKSGGISRNFCQNTYATLTPLQPLTTLALEKADSIYGGITRELLSADTGKNGDRVSRFDYDSVLVNEYELLEPLQPSVYIDREGNSIEFNENMSLSWCNYEHTPFMTPRLASEFSWCDSEDVTESLDDINTLDSSVSSCSVLPDMSLNSAQYVPNPKLVEALKDSLNAEEFDEFMRSEVVDTRELSAFIGYELKRYNIPQSLFSQKVLGRSQGTLSDLLRNTRPWCRLKTGRDQFIKIWLWLQEPESKRLSFFLNSGYKFEASEDAESQNCISDVCSSSTPDCHSQDSNDGSPVRLKKHKSCVTPPLTPLPPLFPLQSLEKRPRILFSEQQRGILLAEFNKNNKPNKQIITSLADQLSVPYTTIANFFVNSRRKLRKDEATATAVKSEESFVPKEQETSDSLDNNLD